MIIREKHCVCRCPLKSFYSYPFREVTFDLSRDHCARILLFSRRGPLRDSTGDRGIGLNMNYSIIFTEISFSPETSILLQIIQIIHMTFGIIPESKSQMSYELFGLFVTESTYFHSPLCKGGKPWLCLISTGGQIFLTILIIYLYFVLTNIIKCLGKLIWCYSGVPVIK